MSLIENLNNIDEYYESEAYYHLLESHLLFFLNDNNNKILACKAHDAARYRGDFYGLLDFLKISKKYHYLTMRLNGYYSASEFEGELRLLLIPQESAFSRIMTVYLSEEV